MVTDTNLDAEITSETKISFVHAEGSWNLPYLWSANFRSQFPVTSPLASFRLGWSLSSFSFWLTPTSAVHLFYFLKTLALKIQSVWMRLVCFYFYFIISIIWLPYLIRYLFICFLSEVLIHACFQFGFQSSALVSPNGKICNLVTNLI